MKNGIEFFGKTFFELPKFWAEFVRVLPLGKTLSQRITILQKFH